MGISIQDESLEVINDVKIISQISYKYTTYCMKKLFFFFNHRYISHGGEMVVQWVALPLFESEG